MAIYNVLVACKTISVKYEPTIYGLVLHESLLTSVDNLDRAPARCQGLEIFFPTLVTCGLSSSTFIRQRQPPFFISFTTKIVLDSHSTQWWREKATYDWEITTLPLKVKQCSCRFLDTKFQCFFQTQRYIDRRAQQQGGRGEGGWASSPSSILTLPTSPLKSV